MEDLNCRYTQVINLDIKQLQYFQCVADAGSFSQASRILGVAQPALSRQIRRLETELHHSLFKRHGRGVRTTEAGKLLLEHCYGILHQVKRAKEDLGGIRGALTGRVDVGLAPSASKMLTIDLTREFGRQLPQASLSIREGLSLIMQEWLLTGQLDIALLYNPTISTDVELTPLTEERLYLVSPHSSRTAPEQPVTLRELASIPLVIPNRPHTLRMLLETQMAQIGCHPTIHIEIDNVSAILGVVADNGGCAVLSQHAVLTWSHPDHVQLTPIVEPQLTSQLYLATATKHISTLTQKEMQKLIFACVRDAYPPNMLAST